MDSIEQKIINRENRLLRNEKSWHRARIGAIFLFIISIIALPSLLSSDSISRDEGNIGIIYGFWFMLLLLSFDQANSNIHHIDSINYYRGKYIGKDDNNI
jgi:hypothetical protein